MNGQISPLIVGNFIWTVNFCLFFLVNFSLCGFYEKSLSVEKMATPMTAPVTSPVAELTSATPSVGSNTIG